MHRLGRVVWAIRNAAWTSLCVALAVTLSCSSSGSSQSTGYTTPCAKFCGESAALSKQCPDALPQKICEGLCKNSDCYTAPGATPSEVKAFFDTCVSDMNLEVVCNSEQNSTIPQPLGCRIATLDGYTHWVWGWEASGKPSVCQ